MPKVFCSKCSLAGRHTHSTAEANQQGKTHDQLIHRGQPTAKVSS